MALPFALCALTTLSTATSLHFSVFVCAIGITSFLSAVLLCAVVQDKSKQKQCKGMCWNNSLCCPVFDCPSPRASAIECCRFLR
jgi:hypothetical protein